MTPEDRERLAKSRWQMLLLLRLTGIIVMIAGMWSLSGGSMLGVPIFALGLFDALVLPTILAGRWKSLPEE